MNKIACFLTVLLVSFLPESGSSQEEAYIVRYSGIPSNASIFEIYVMEDNSKLIASDIGLFKITSFEKDARKMEEGNFTALAVDKNDGIWLGEYGGYVIKQGSDVRIPLAEKHIEIRSIVPVKTVLWVGTNDGIFIINARNNKLIKQYKKGDEGLRSNDISFIHDDGEYLWIGTEKGVYRVKDDQWKLFEKQKRMDVIFSNHEGNWLISEDEMWVIDPFQRWYPAALNKGLKQGAIRDIAIDKAGKLYLASEKLVRYDPYQEVIHDYEASLGTLSKKCQVLACDQSDDIWIGTSGSGLYMIRFDTPENIPFNASIIIEKSIICEGSGATVLAEVNGGKAPYNYRWNNGQTEARVTALLPGNYTVSVSDATGDTVVTELQLEGPVPVQMRILDKKAISGPGKTDGTARIIATGGKAPYSISWDNGEKGLMAIKLSSGNHTLTITDDLGCTTIAQIEIEREKFIPNLDISKIEVGQTLLINELYFQADSTEVMESSFGVLEEIYSFLSDNSGVVIEIGGHTNNIPPHEYCDNLSSERARNVALYLFNKGISEDRISYKGYGKRNPIASNNSLSGRKKNQRVEIKVLSID